MRFETLRYFTEIAESKSLAAAARRLFISHQGLSKAIRQMEQELGVELFTRSGRGLELTEAGRAIAPCVDECLSSYDRLKAAVEPYRDSARDPRIELLVCPFVGISIFNHMRDQLDAFGLRRVTLVEEEFSRILDKVIGSEALALTIMTRSMKEGIRDWDDLVFKPLFSCELGVVGDEKIVTAGPNGISPADASRLPVACYSETLLDDMLAEAFACHPLSNVVFKGTNLSLIDEYVTRGIAATFSDTLSFCFEPAVEGRVFAPLRPRSDFLVGFLFRTGSDLEGASARYARRFAECVEATCGSYLESHPIRASWLDDGAPARSRERAR